LRHVFSNYYFLHRFLENYIIQESQHRDPVVFPFYRPSDSFTKLPPTLCILAELDPLRDDGIGKNKNFLREVRTTFSLSWPKI
jgi:acetyl esterase/lipase